MMLLHFTADLKVYLNQKYYYKVYKILIPPVIGPKYCDFCQGHWHIVGRARLLQGHYFKNQTPPRTLLEELEHFKQSEDLKQLDSYLSDFKTALLTLKFRQYWFSKGRSSWFARAVRVKQKCQRLMQTLIGEKKWWIRNINIICSWAIVPRMNTPKMISWICNKELDLHCMACLQRCAQCQNEWRHLVHEITV